MSIRAISAEPILGQIRPELAIVSTLGSHVVGQYVLTERAWELQWIPDEAV